MTCVIELKNRLEKAFGIDIEFINGLWGKDIIYKDKEKRCYNSAGSFNTDEECIEGLYSIVGRIVKC